MSTNITEETLNLIKAAHASQDINKNITAGSVTTTVTGTGLTAYDLQAPAKNLYPVQTPIRNTLPRTGGIGTATNWRTVRSIIGSGFDGMGWVPEGQRSGRMSYLTQALSASYKTMGEEDQATYEAISAGRGFEDIRARMTMRLLQKLMLKEESAIIGGNTSVALSTPAAPTVSIGASGGSLAADTYYVYCVALTYEGYRNSSVSGGVATSQTITGADGLTFTLSGGSSNRSAASAGQAITGAQTLRASVPAVNGAIAYAWFVSPTPNATTTAYLQKITTINSVEITTALVTSTQIVSTISANNSTNTYAFDGLMYQAFNPTSGAYIATQATGTAGTGTPLTSSGRGSVDEIDQMLVTMWNNNQLSPTVIYCNAQEIKNISNKVLTGASSAPLVRYNVGGNENSMQIQASPFIDTYYNPITKQPLRVEVHPNIPAGTILAWADNLPAQYQSSEVPNVAEIRARQDYYQIDWPVTSRQQQVGVYCEEVLVCYAPFAIGIITNIANG